MRVLISAGMIQQGRCGVGRYVISLCEALVREQPSVELYVAGLDQDRALFPWLADERWVSIPAGMAGGAANILWHQWYLNRLVAKLGIDLVHIPSYCGSSNTVLRSEFGSTACKAIHVCNACRQPFDEFKAF